MGIIGKIGVLEHDPHIGLLEFIIWHGRIQLVIVVIAVCANLYVIFPLIGYVSEPPQADAANHEPVELGVIKRLLGYHLVQVAVFHGRITDLYTPFEVDSLGLASGPDNNFLPLLRGFFIFFV